MLRHTTPSAFHFGDRRAGAHRMFGSRYGTKGHESRRNPIGTDQVHQGKPFESATFSKLRRHEEMERSEAARPKSGAC